MPPITIAAMNGMVELVKVLVDAKADLKMIDDQMWWASCKGGPQVKKVLLKAILDDEKSG